MRVNLRNDAARHDELLRRRLDLIVPALMRREGIDCWIVAGREYAEDPVLRTMLPSTWMSARRRTVLICSIPAPDPTSAWFNLRNSSMPTFASAGASSMAEPPPETRK